MQYLEGSSSLETEKRRVQLLMALFGGAYLLRGGFDLVIGIYLTEFEQFNEDKPGFFEAVQAAYFIIVDIVPMSALFNLHHKMYGENANRAGVRMQQDPELARA